MRTESQRTGDQGAKALASIETRDSRQEETGTMTSKPIDTSKIKTGNIVTIRPRLNDSDYRVLVMSINRKRQTARGYHLGDALAGSTCSFHLDATIDIEKPTEYLLTTFNVGDMIAYRIPRKQGLRFGRVYDITGYHIIAGCHTKSDTIEAKQVVALIETSETEDGVRDYNVALLRSTPGIIMNLLDEAIEEDERGGIPADQITKAMEYLTSLTEEAEDAARRIQGFEEQIGRDKNDIASLKQQLATMTNAAEHNAEQANEAQAMIRRQTSATAGAEVDSVHYQEQVKEWKVTAEGLRDENEALARDLESAKRDLGKAETETTSDRVAELEQANYHLGEELEELDKVRLETIKNLQEHLEIAEAKIKELAPEGSSADTVMAIIDRFQDRLETSRKLNTTLQSDVDRLVGENDQASLTAKQLNQEAFIMTAKIRGLALSIANLKADKQIVEDSRQETSETIHQLNQEIKRLGEIRVNLIKRIDEQSSQIMRLADERNSLKGALDKAEENLEAAVEASGKALKEAEEKAFLAEAAYEVAYGEREEARQRIKGLEETCDAHSEAYERASAEIADMQERIQEQIKESNRTVSKLRNDIEEANDATREAENFNTNEHIEDLQTEVAERKHQNREDTENLVKVSKQISVSLAKLKDATKDAKRKGAMLDDYETTMEELKGQRDHAREQAEKLALADAENEATIKELEIGLAGERRSRDKRSDSHSARLHQYKELSDKHRQTLCLLQNAVEERETMASRNLQLKTELEDATERIGTLKATVENLQARVGESK